MLLAGACTLAGCADYMGHRDSVTLGVGDAMLANQALQAVDSFPPDAHNTRIEGSGRRVQGAMERYTGAAIGRGNSSPAGGANNNPCDFPDDTAADGSRCGGRSSSEKAGGEEPVP
ncbi:pilus biosynthesis protein [Mesorhizobium sp. L103C119B0]|nr:pilus biosynthesis protein [Mesorhizobium sp. L103C119B0]